MRILQALAFYVGKTVLPLHETPFAVGLPSPLATAVVLALAAGFALGAVYLRRRGDPVPLLGVAAFFVSVTPAFLVAISPQFSLTPVAERYLYVPSIGLSIVVGDLVARSLTSLRWRPAVWAAVALVLIVAATASVARTRIWKSDLGFWQYVIRDPAAARQAAPWYNLGFAYEDAGRLQKAHEAFRRARRGAGTASFHAQALRQVAEAEFGEAIAAFDRRDFRTAEARAQQARAVLSDARSLDPAPARDDLDAAR